MEITVGQRTFQVDGTAPLDIAIPLHFDGPQPNAFGVPDATAQAYQDGPFIGDTRRGGSCNFDEIRLIPHCNGTHTECVGHITDQRIAIYDVWTGGFVPSTLVSIKPELASSTDDTYDPPLAPDDLLITRRSLEEALRHVPPAFLHGLILRTLPNPPEKRFRRYATHPAPFFSIEAIHLINDLNVSHLLVDMPSVDRANDEGKLTVHHLYWHIPRGSHQIESENYSRKTITELIYADDAIPDGPYLLSLNLPPFVADAAPSRPLLYRVSTR